MSETPSGQDPGLHFQCPRCGARAEDDWETIDALTPVDWRCEQCHRPFNVLLVECGHCAGETVRVALGAAELPPPEEVVCRECGKHCLNHGEAACAK